MSVDINFNDLDNFMTLLGFKKIMDVAYGDLVNAGKCASSIVGSTSVSGTIQIINSPIILQPLLIYLELEYIASGNPPVPSDVCYADIKIIGKGNNYQKTLWSVHNEQCVFGPF